MPNWKDIDKNELVIKACENRTGPIHDSYISAIVLKYWPKLERYSWKYRIAATPEDVHTWLIIAIEWAIEHRPWELPESTIYQDKCGPDKVINRVMESRKNTFYQQLNRNNRKFQSDHLSLDMVMGEDSGSSLEPEYIESYNVEYDEIIKEYFRKKDYFMAFLFDVVLYETSVVESGYKCLTTYLMTLDEVQCKIFAHRYALDEESVINASKYLTNLSRHKMKARLDRGLCELKRLLRKWGNSYAD